MQRLGLPAVVAAVFATGPKGSTMSTKSSDSERRIGRKMGQQSPIVACMGVTRVSNIVEFKLIENWLEKALNGRDYDLVQLSATNNSLVHSHSCRTATKLIVLQ